MANTVQSLNLAQVEALRRDRTVDIPAVLPQRDLYSVRPTEVRAGPGRIEYRGADAEGATATDCLFNFVRLADADDPDEFIRFAAVHGVLGLTENGLPGIFNGKGSATVPGDEGWRFERISLWKAYAQNAKMLLILAMALRNDDRIDPIAVLESAGIERKHVSIGGRVSPSDRTYKLAEQELYRVPGGVMPGEEGSVFFGILPGLADISLIFTAKDVESQRRSLMVWLEYHWLGLANIVPAVEWSSGPPRLLLKLSHRSPTVSHEAPQLSYWPENTLFSVLAAEIAGIICSDRYVSQCAHCFALHPSRIKVRTDQPNYCDSCRVKVRRETNRKAQRKRYARQKAERAAN